MSEVKLDAKIKEFLDQLAFAPAVNFETLQAEDLRSGPDAVRNFAPQAQTGLRIENSEIKGEDDRSIAIRTYSPEGLDAGAPTLIYIHGGCWVFCSLDTHDTVCQYLSKNGNLKVISVDYRLAPEHKFPAGLEDVYAVAKHFKDEKLMICGDSAGGNMSTVVSMMARDRKEFKIQAQILFYPITDISNFDTASYEEFATGHLLTRELMQWSAEKYINSIDERRHPYVSPLLSSNLADLPIAFILTAEADVLRDEAEAYAKKLEEAGNCVLLKRYDGMIHAFVGMAGSIEGGQLALNNAIEFISKQP
jgi:acetyl esterase